MICSVIDMVKQCSKCKKWLLKDRFNKSKDRKSGLQYWCIDCSKKYRDQNIAQLKTGAKKWRQENSKKQKIQQKEWGKKNPERAVWRDILQRCNNLKNPAYKNYGGRGIKVLYKTFDEFIQDVGLRPTSKHSIDRIDNDGHYALGNVKWSTMKEQQNNKRNNKKNWIKYF